MKCEGFFRAGLLYERDSFDCTNEKMFRLEHETMNICQRNVAFCSRVVQV